MTLRAKHLFNLSLIASMLMRHFMLSILLNHNPAILLKISVTRMQMAISHHLSAIYCHTHPG